MRRHVAGLLVGLLLLPGGGAWAGLSIPGGICDGACQSALASFVPQYFEAHAPVLSSPAELFTAADAADPASCPRRSQPGPAVFGVMMGPTYGRSALAIEGPVNDVQLMTQVMRDRGVDAQHVTAVTGRDATRAGMIGAMGKFLPCLRERDQIVLHFTGWASIYPAEWFSHEAFLESYCGRDRKPEGDDVCEKLRAPDVTEFYLDGVSRAIREATLSWLLARQPSTAYLPGGRLHVLVSDDISWVPREEGQVPDLYDGVTATEISNFVTRVRNRGADAFLIIDTRLAGSGDLVALQQQAAAPPAWAADGDAILQNDGFPALQGSLEAQGIVPLFGTGQFAVLYGSDQDSDAYEYKQGADLKQLGALTFRVSELMRADGTVKFVDMARTLATSFDERNRQVSGGRQEPMFMASSLDLALLAPRAGTPVRQDGRIEVIQPSPKRGAVEQEGERLVVVARYDGPERPRLAIVNGEPVQVDQNGQFRHEIEDAAGLFTISLRVLGGEYQTLASSDLRIRDKPDEPVIATPARRVALVIANQAYLDPAFPPLKTPLADAEAIAAVLERRFGFRTRIATGATELDLFLKDATKAQVQQTLFELRRALTAEDQLLVYYAGHGEYDPDLGAFWVPVDGQDKADYSWIDANDITTELKRMNAASVLVISDSCYAGGLTRGGDSGAGGETARGRYLAKASRLKSRQLMASGGEEPVEDGGGGGHSVFAAALIAALQAMPDEAFTASELFEQKVKPAVISAANALSEGQTPVFSRIARAGDEPGSEFVFQSAAASP